MMEKKRLSKWVEDIEQILADKKLPSIETIMRLSRNIYEGAYVKTEIVFMKDDPADLMVRFDGSSILPLAEEVIQAGEIKQNCNFIERMNKYCHMTNDKISLFATRMDLYNADTYEIVGIGKVTENTQWLARLKLEGHLKWTLQFSDNENKIHYDGLFLERILPKITIPEEFDAASTEIINKIANCAKEQLHGTMLVVLDEEEAEKEADRLCVELLRGIRVDKFDITEHLADIIVPITSIDGAVLIDKSGYCYGLGVILDGTATTPANSARGARFNSACVYVNNKKKDNKRCLCVVISEDGMIDPICTENIDTYNSKNSEQLNRNALCEENNVYYLNSMQDAYCEGMTDREEAKHSLLHGDPDCF